MRKFLLALAYCLFQLLSPYTASSQDHKKVDSLLNIIKTEKEDTNKVKTLNSLSKLFLNSEPEKSLEYSKQSLALAQKLDFKKFIFNNYQNIAGYYYYRGDIKLSREYFNKALGLAEQINDKPSLGKVYNNLSLLAIRQLDYSSAIEYSEKGLQLAGEMKDSSLLSAILNNTGIIYLNISDYPTAFNYFFKSLAICEQKNNKQGVGINQHYIGYAYMLSNNPDKAIEYYKLSLKSSKEANDHFQQAQTLDKIGEVYQEKKDWTMALDYFQQAIAIARELGSFSNIISSLQNIGMIYNSQGKFEDAKQSISDALQLAKQTDDKMGVGNCYGYFGKIYLNKKDYKTAIKYFDQSIEVAREIKVKDNEADGLMNLATCYKLLNDYKEAYRYLNEYKVVEDSVMNKETVIKTAEIDAKYNLLKKEKEIALLTKDKQIQTLEIKKSATIQNSLIIGLILICILSFFIYRYYRTQHLLKLQTLRNKIASDLHDEVGSTLSSIAIFSEIARQESKEVAPMLDQIGENSRKMLESMADIVWTINPENDNFEKIIFRMRSFAFELLGARKIDFEFNVDDAIINLKLKMEVRKNLYLIFKEAVNNIVKYSNADKASFSITGSQNDLTFLIRDNGKGFNIEESSDGNGLKNMQTRAIDIGAKFLIESEIGRGTTIQLLLKVA